jgi:4-amino-4-deoxy-L-arabinose transferase-like glycosyltransferase
LATLPRIGRARGRSATADRWLLLGLALLLIGPGIGVRDPAGVDEERFAGIALEMLQSGEWLIPHRAGEVYSDKPPLFFWLVALGTWLTGSVALALRLPALTAALASVALVHDLGTRLWHRRVGLTAGLLLLATWQWVSVLRAGQIDGLLVLWTTLGLYGLVRHLVAGPSWGWYAVAGAAIGLGIVTKGVGFLPLFLFVPYAVGLRRQARWLSHPARPARRWWLGPLCLIAATLVWLGPLLGRVAGSSDPALAAYLRDLFVRQTGERLVAAWQHREPFWYFTVEVIPLYWLPIVALLPWLVPAWRRKLARGDGRLLLLLGWIALVVLFFSLSTGKRKVYIAPAVPALALAAAPLVPWLVHRLVRIPGRRRLVRLAVVVYFAGLLTYVLGDWLHDAGAESRRTLMARVAGRIGPDAELGLVGWRDGHWLYARNPLVHFGYRETVAEVPRAAAWLREGRNRWLLGPASRLAPCFVLGRAVPIGRDKDDLFLVHADQVSGDCGTPTPGPRYHFRWRTPYGSPHLREVGAEQQVLPHRHAGEEAAPLEHVGQAPAEQPVRRHLRDRRAVEDHAAGRRPDEARHRVEERALPRAVGAEEARHLAPPDLEPHVAQREVAAVPDLERLNGEHRRLPRRCRPPAGRLRRRLDRRCGYVQFVGEARGRRGAALGIPSGSFLGLIERFVEVLKPASHGGPRQESGGGLPPRTPCPPGPRRGGRAVDGSPLTTRPRHPRRLRNRGSRSAPRQGRRVLQVEAGAPRPAIAWGPWSRG